MASLQTNLRCGSALLATVLVGFGAASQTDASVVFDNISSVQNATAGAAANATGSTPNTFMGDGYTLLSGTTSITGFDAYPVNNTGTAFTAIRLTIYVWGTVNTGAVSAAAPAFSNLLGTYTVTSTGTFTSGFFYNFESSTPGVTPGISLATPLVLTGNTVGLTFNFQGSTDGVTFASANSLSSIITSGPAPTVGSLTLGTAGTNGYYRNANSEVNGNFTSTLRSLAGLTNQGVATRIYGNVVPEPGTWAMISVARLRWPASSSAAAATKLQGGKCRVLIHGRKG